MDIVTYSPFYRDHMSLLASSWENQFWCMDEVQKTLRYDYNHCQLVLVEGAAQGCILYTLQNFESELLFLFVYERQRLQGYGRYLLEAYFKACQLACVDHLFLEVRASNPPALRLYQSAGYKVFHERKNYYRNGDTAILLKKVL